MLNPKIVSQYNLWFLYHDIEEQKDSLNLGIRYRIHLK